ncbi:MAG TPA: Eco57I restriction-modification methylase domain-containing protein [Tepidisphaeraceae bacterium]|jgi:hypothetical protein|nr:Eco57I restriction-modification methylase domain-containing protein [Tepidisphaeraceae bacterium]
MPHAQLQLQFSPIRNHGLFSNHWLENRLPLEPEWVRLRADAIALLSALTDLWRVQRNRVEQYGGEQALEQAFIQPVLDALGWRLLYQTHLRQQKPDYALFDNDASLEAALAAGRLSEAFWQHPVVVADAKAWHVPLDRPTVVNTKREYPPEQIERYLNYSHLDYAILTNGRLWRLIPREHDAGQARFQTYLECDLTKLLDDRLAHEDVFPEAWEAFADFLRFYLFFSPVALRATAERPSLVTRARRGSSEYRLGVGEGLKQRVFDALGLCIEGFLAHAPNGLSPERDMERCRQESLILLYRLLFVLFAEDRKLLPYRVDRAYTDNRSLGRFREEIAGRLDRVANGREADYPPGDTGIWSDLRSLFDLIDAGAARYKVPAYNGGLFDGDAHSFLSSNSLPDHFIARVIDQLSRAPDPAHPDAGMFRVDYRDLAIQHLGDVYEGLLELRPHFASEEMVVLRARGEERIAPASADVPRGFEFAGARYAVGSVYLLTDKGERRASGSYYTPNHIVDYIVEKTLGPLCDRIDAALREEIEKAQAERPRARGENRAALDERLACLGSDFDDRVLQLRVLDPAMGSGHFLIRACQFLAEQIATNPNAGDPAAASLQADESLLTFWKRQVVERCLYGVDRNPMAVEDLGSLPDAPPLMSNVFEQHAKGRLPVLLKALEMIRRTPSDTVEHVKEKDKAYQRVFEPARDPLRKAAHVWCAVFFVDPDKRPSLEQYRALLETLDKPVKLKALLEQEPYATAIAISGPGGVAAFHWELEFPEVFFGDAGIRADSGFDAIIGNPPYDVLSERETGRDLTALQAFFRSRRVYAPSLVGKNNLYKLFICRVLALLAEGGLLGFITPMAVLGDEQASGIRRAILAAGAFRNIEAFPQKDDPERRVFRDAKLSTAVFVVHKTEKEAERALPFTSRIHPANVIDPGSPTLQMSAPAIPLYDPENMTIVSCRQDDWDLAIRVTGAGRMERLMDVAEFFQGEVNETNERSKGNLIEDGTAGTIVIRGAGICLYVSRASSQGTELFLDVDRFLAGKGAETKAFHHRHARVCLQESSPQNNFRRIIAAIIPAGEFCNHTINYCPAHRTKMPLEFIVALLNTKLADWYFRLGSTNAHVSQYQLQVLPCPTFADAATASDDQMQQQAIAAVRAGRPSDALAALAAGLSNPPFSLAVRETIIEAVGKIIAIESARGEISRSDRSALAPAAQPYQDLIDRLFYAMAGMTDAEARSLEQRLAQML